MIIVDVNLLLYSVVTGFPQHGPARTWWEDTLNGPAEVGLTGPAIFGFLRVSTNPRILSVPLSVDAAGQYVTDWLERPNVSFVQPTRRQLDVAIELLGGVGTAGNLTTDAQLAATAIDLDAEMCSNDADFGRFRGLRWVNPLAPLTP